MQTNKKGFFSSKTMLSALISIGVRSQTIAAESKGEMLKQPPAKTYDPEKLDLTKPTLFVVPYSHLDDIWRWNYPQTVRDFLRNTLDDNFEALEEFPHFVFNWSGASRYAMMKEYYPKRYEELKEWAEAGRWFPSGSSWVENDTNVPSGESQIRQLLMGHKYFKEEFNKESVEYMLPDCFGFPYSLPSLLSHCGMRGFSTQKLTWGSANGIPFNIGRWIGPDGESVIAALNGGDYARPHKVVYSHDEKTLGRLKENEKVSGLPIDYFYMGGGDDNNADRGGRPHKISLESLEKAYEKDGPINVVAGRSDLMFRAITDEQAEKFPTWEKDLLLIQHSTGVLTSQTYQKQLNRDGELLADAAEKAAVTASYMTGAVYPKQQLDYAWGLTLRNQFHDTLPGTSLPIAHAYAWNDGIISLNGFDGVYTDAVGSLARSMNTNVPGVPVVVYNPLSIERNDIVEAFVPEALADAAAITAYDGNGKALPTQLTRGWDGKRRVMFQASVPAVGGAVFSLREESPLTDSELRVGSNTLENTRYKVTINKDGDIASVYDKKVGKELLEKPSQLEVIQNFPDRKPAWRIYYKDIIKPARSVANNPVQFRIVENGPVRVAIEVIREVEGSKLAQRIRLYSGSDSDRVEVANHFDWRTRNALLKAAFHFTAKNEKATYNLDLGTIQRGNRHKKMYEVPTHGWFNLTDTSGSHGTTILTGPKYGTDKPDNNTLRLTLIHSPETEEWEDETLDRGRTKEMRWQDCGRHEINYAISGYKGEWQNSNPHQEALRMEQRLAAFVVPKHNGSASSISLMNIDTNKVNIQAVKMAENGSGVVIRLQELHGKAQNNVTVKTALQVRGAEELNGVETPINVNVPVSNNSISLNFTPYEIKTVLLKTAKPEAKVTTTPVALKYDCDVFSTNENREDGWNNREYISRHKERVAGSSGSFDGKGGTLPAEMIGDTVTMGNVEFQIGAREEYNDNAVSCRGQKIELPKGSTVVHILAAAEYDKEVTFKAGGKEFSMTIGGWTGNLGQWDNRTFEGELAEVSYSIRNPLKEIEPAYVRDQRVAWSASHYHKPTGDTLYEYSYLYAYRLELPKGVTSVTLPNSPFVRIIAMSVGDEGTAEGLQNPFEDLHRDEEFTKRFATVNETN